MSTSLVLEVAISMVFLYLLGSQVVLSIYELWAGYTNSRGKFLYRRLKETIGEKTTQQLYAQQSIAALTPRSQEAPEVATTGPKRWLGVDIKGSNAFKWWLGMDGLPAYIPADLFASTLLAMVKPAATKQDELADAVATATASSTWLSVESQALLKGILSTLQPTASLVDCQKAVALWYDAYGERLTGWYKRQVRLWLFLVGLLVAFAGNIDSPFILRYLWAHPQLSKSVADAAAREAQTMDGAKLREADKKATTLNQSNAAGSAGKLVPSGLPTSETGSLNRLTLKNDSLQHLLRASRTHVEALDKRLRGLGFPIGRADSVKADSTGLPTPFYVRQMAPSVRQGRVLFPDSGRYLRYAKRDTVVATHKGTYWKKTYLPLRAVTADLLTDGRDRSSPDTGFGPLFGPQSQSAWHTILGWFITALALSVGAPFWFDLLCRLVNIRNLGIKPPRPEQ